MTMAKEPEEPRAEWGTRCKTCGRSKHFIRRENASNDAAIHRQEYPGHDVRLISVPLD
jgi:hypothetical protein